MVKIIWISNNEKMDDDTTHIIKLSRLPGSFTTFLDLRPVCRYHHSKK